MSQWVTVVLEKCRLVELHLYWDRSLAPGVFVVLPSPKYIINDRVISSKFCYNHNMQLDLSKLNYQFKSKPLLIGGKAMEYYGLRKAGDDIDLIVKHDDLTGLLRLYPTKVKDLWGDLGVAVHGFEIWKTIRLFDYNYWAFDAIEEDNYFVISLEKLLIQKALAMNIPKYHTDLELLVAEISKRQHSTLVPIQIKNSDMLSNIKGIEYVEQKGPTNNA